MCGILAALGFEPPGRALDLVAHRGPDGAGWARFDSPAGPVTLGHRRLAIIDLSDGGRQPMTSADGRFTLAYNGEIYNYRELRAELEAHGRSFRTESDSEVLLQAYAAWGPACLNRFNGMFAFVLWDDVKKCLFAARDRFAVKPLYWHAGPDRLAVVSEIKQLTALPGFAATSNDARLTDYLAWGLFDHTDETLFAGVRQLRGGTYLTARAADGFVPTVARWYRLPDAAPFAGTAEDAAVRLRSLLEDALRLRLRSDVPVASCLSGGIDSSGIVCLLEGLRADAGTASTQLAFSAVFDDPEADERRFVDIVDAATTVDIRRVVSDEAALTEVAGRMLWHQDEPFGSTSLFAQWSVFQAAAAAGLKVMLDGQGADEVFAGYLTTLGYHHAGLLRRGRMAGFVRALAADRRRHGTGTWAQLALTAAAMGALSALRGPLARIGHPSTAPWMRRDKLAPGTAFERSWHTRFGRRPAGLQALRESLVLDTSLPMLLHHEDRNAMAHGIEARVPYLDYRLVEFALSLPADLLVRDGQTKSVLRQALRGAVPPPVLARDDKLGFATPERRWLATVLGPWARRHAARTLDRRPDLFVPGRAKALIDPANADAASRRPLWRLAMVDLWTERFGIS